MKRKYAVAPNEATAIGGPGRGFQDPAAPTSLSPRELAAVRAMLSGAKPAAVAEQLGVSRQTVWRWSRQPAFMTELRRLNALTALGARPPTKKAGAGRV
jgi:hypothetical protein